jgi:hypothetical protein
MGIFTATNEDRDIDLEDVGVGAMRFRRLVSDYYHFITASRIYGGRMDFNGFKVKQGQGSTNDLRTYVLCSLTVNMVRGSVRER